MAILSIQYGKYALWNFMEKLDLVVAPSNVSSCFSRAEFCRLGIGVSWTLRRWCSFDFRTEGALVSLLQARGQPSQGSRCHTCPCLEMRPGTPCPPLWPSPWGYSVYAEDCAPFQSKARGEVQLISPAARTWQSEGEAPCVSMATPWHWL